MWVNKVFKAFRQYPQTEEYLALLHPTKELYVPQLVIVSSWFFSEVWWNTTWNIKDPLHSNMCFSYVYTTPKMSDLDFYWFRPCSPEMCCYIPLQKGVDVCARPETRRAWGELGLISRRYKSQSLSGFISLLLMCTLEDYCRSVIEITVILTTLILSITASHRTTDSLEC